MSIYKLVWLYVAVFALGLAAFASAGVHDPRYPLNPMTEAS